VDGEQPLVRIDYRREAGEAPYQFDMANAVLHRTGCKAIRKDGRSALYGIWQVGPEDAKHACERCRPVPIQDEAIEKKSSSDTLFGFLSILDQFGSVLNERGREYRDSERGRQVEATIESLFSELDYRQRETLDVILSSLDRLIGVIEDYNQTLRDQMNGSNGRGTTDAGSNEGRAAG
jgi:hypothetical protein